MVTDAMLHEASGTRVRFEHGRAIVTSEHVALPLRCRTGAAPGTGVRLDGKLWEVVSGVRTGRGERWELAPWTGPEVVRSLVTLDTASIEALVSRERARRSGRRRRHVMTVLAPVLGFAPGPWQERWRNEWAYPAMGAVITTSLIEIVARGAASLQVMVAMFGGGFFFPGFLRHFVVLGPLLFAEGTVRLGISNAHGEPVGSALSAILLVPGALGKRGGRGAKSPPASAFIVGTAWRTVAACFAPGRYQVRWGRHVSVPPVVLTFVGAFFECLGGLRDLAGGGRGPAWLTVLSLVIFADGMVRLVLAVLTRGPVGSVFGAPFSPFFERWIGGVGQAFDETGRRSQKPPTSEVGPD